MTNTDGYIQILANEFGIVRDIDERKIKLRNSSYMNVKNLFNKSIAKNSADIPQDKDNENKSNHNNTYGEEKTQKQTATPTTIESIAFIEYEGEETLPKIKERAIKIKEHMMKNIRINTEKNSPKSIANAASEENSNNDDSLQKFYGSIAQAEQNTNIVNDGERYSEKELPEEDVTPISENISMEENVNNDSSEMNSFELNNAVQEFSERELPIVVPQRYDDETQIPEEVTSNTFEAAEEFPQTIADVSEDITNESSAENDLEDQSFRISSNESSAAKVSKFADTEVEFEEFKENTIETEESNQLNIEPFNASKRESLDIQQPIPVINEFATDNKTEVAPAIDLSVLNAYLNNQDNDDDSETSSSESNVLIDFEYEQAINRAKELLNQKRRINTGIESARNQSIEIDGKLTAAKEAMIKFADNLEQKCNDSYQELQKLEAQVADKQAQYDEMQAVLAEISNESAE